MSIHKSLKTKGRLVRQRNVLSRIERLEKLKRESRWTEEDSPFSLPKVKTIRPKKRGKKEKKKEEEAAAAEAAKGEEGKKESK